MVAQSATSEGDASDSDLLCVEGKSRFSLAARLAWLGLTSQDVKTSDLGVDPGFGQTTEPEN